MAAYKDGYRAIDSSTNFKLDEEAIDVYKRQMLGSVVPGNGKRHGFKGRGDTFLPYSHRQRADTGM